MSDEINTKNDNYEHPDIVNQIVASLINSFCLDDNCQNAILEDQNCETLKEAVRMWTLKTLTSPGEKMSALMIPWIAHAFHYYICELKRLK